jgi:pimeloyl-ACP methyl ester carboxylesterase
VSAFAAVGLSVEFCDPDAMRPFTERGQDLSRPALGSHSFPKLFITGERDQLAPPGELLELVERLPAPKSVQIVPGADHFWWGSERKLGEQVADFVAGLSVDN